MPLNCDVYNYVAREKVSSSNILSLGISGQWVGGETQSAFETLHYSFIMESLRESFPPSLFQCHLPRETV